VVSYVPVPTDPDGRGVSILGHFARTDADAHDLGADQLYSALCANGPFSNVSR
jgi:hypothetical protein